ncbi:hypothetical protein I7I51_02012 [Histoplasma capsulatum]|uniref:Uncharacterized protein n=1 Tax=Ajellomyces capsulatus TaxID=5037 RepID=A0A8A1MEL4_AJECA|nr:hypothetical protein I7I51_02012 [Histoplasma capsulatum]
MKAQYIVIGLDALEIANFPVIGRGVRTLQHFKYKWALCTVWSRVMDFIYFK